SPAISAPERVSMEPDAIIAAGFAAAAARKDLTEGEQVARTIHFPSASKREFRARLHARELMARANGRGETETAPRKRADRTPARDWYTVLGAVAAAFVLVVGFSVVWRPLVAPV